VEVRSSTVQSITMPPRGKAKKTPRPLDSSDEEEEEEQEVEPARRERQPKKVFSKAAIYNAVLGSGLQTVRANVPGLVAPAEVQADWAAWLTSTAERLEDVPASERPLPLHMPMKCVAAGQERLAPQSIAMQVELLTYQNPDGGAGVSKGTREYEARQTKALLEGMTDVGDVVAVKRPKEHEADRAGFRTPFYVGKVLRVHFVETAGSSSSSKREIHALDVHWHYPFLKGQPCDDVNRKWLPACQGLLHEWTRQCEMRLACKNCRRAELGDTSREWSQVTADTILEVGLKMTPTTSQLSKPAKERLAAGNAELAKILGVNP
jgi:hypothetical protein